MENYRKYRCDRYGNTCEDCPIKEICFYLFDLPFGKSDTESYLKIYEQGRADAINEFAEYYQSVGCTHIDDGCRLEDDFACFKCFVNRFKEETK